MGRTGGRQSRQAGRAEREPYVEPREGISQTLTASSASMPHLIITAGNDQHLRLWDTRHFSHLNPRSTEILTPPPTVNGDSRDPLSGESDVATHINTRPISSIGNEKVGNFMNSSKGKGMQRAAFQHGKSCSAAYWDPWGRRILSTSYDDKLRSE